MSLFHQQPAEMSDTAYNNYIRNLIHAVQDQSTDSLKTLRNLLASPPPEDNPQEIAELFGAMLHIAIWPIETTATNEIFYHNNIVVEKIRLLLEAGADANIDNHPLINQKNSFHRKPIHNVCHSSHLKMGNIRFRILQLLLDHGADPNIQDDFKHTQLHFVCDFVCINENGQEVPDLASLQLLIDHGADLDIDRYIENPNIFKQARREPYLDDDASEIGDVEDEFEVDLIEFLSELDCGDRYVELIVSAIIHYIEDKDLDPACKEKMREYIKYTFGFDASLASVPFEEFIKYPNLRKMTILALERKEAENYEGMSHMMMCHVRNMLENARYLESHS